MRPGRAVPGGMARRVGVSPSGFGVCRAAAPRAAVVIAALVAGLLPMPVDAQERPAESDLSTAETADAMVLTLDQALDYAAGANPTLRQATNSATLNATESRSLWFNQLLPSANLTLFETGFTGNLRRRALDNFGNPIPNPSAEWNYFSQTSHRFGLNWTIQGPSLFQAHRTQSLTNQDRELAVRGALTDLQAEVQRLYMDALEQRELVLAEEALIEARQIDLDVAQRLFELALRTRVDVLSAELQLEQQRLTHQQQGAVYQRALLALRTAMGLSENRPLELSDEPLPLFDPSGLDADALIARATEVNPSLLRSDLAMRSNEVALARRGADWWPEINLGMSVFKVAYEPYAEALFEPPGTSELESQFYVQLSFPILNGYFQQQVERDRAAVELRNSRELDRQTRLELEEAIRGALLDLENEWASLQLSERSLVIAEEALRLAREEYRLGTRTFSDLRDSFQQEADTRRAVITTRHRFVDALLTLEAAVGAPVRTGAGF